MEHTDSAGKLVDAIGRNHDTLVDGPTAPAVR